MTNQQNYEENRVKYEDKHEVLTIKEMVLWFLMLSGVV